MLTQDHMADRTSDINGPDDGDKLRLMELQALPVTSARARAVQICTQEKLHYHGFRPTKTGPTLGERLRSVRWSPLFIALLIGFAAGVGVWWWRTAEAKSKAAIAESPVEYHKRQFLAELRGTGANGGSMQTRVDRMRFHQRVLMSHGFLAERKFVFTNGAAKARLAVGRIDGVNMEYAMVEPRGKDVLAVIAPRDDMPAWESVMQLAGGKMKVSAVSSIVIE